MGARCSRKKVDLPDAGEPTNNTTSGISGGRIIGVTGIGIVAMTVDVYGVSGGIVVSDISGGIVVFDEGIVGVEI